MKKGVALFVAGIFPIILLFIADLISTVLIWGVIIQFTTHVFVVGAVKVTFYALAVFCILKLFPPLLEWADIKKGTFFTISAIITLAEIMALCLILNSTNGLFFYISFVLSIFWAGTSDKSAEQVPESPATQEESHM